MEFEVVRNDIVNMGVDAIILPANPELREGSGTSRAIYEKAGREELTKECGKALKKYGKIQIGDVIPTLGFGLDASFIIHAVVPKWVDGKHAEYAVLSATYLAALDLADEMDCGSVAFPLLASGHNGFDKKIAFEIAKESIESYKPKNKLQKTFPVVYDVNSMGLMREMGINVQEEIDAKYVFQHREYETYPKNGAMDKAAKWMKEYFRREEVKDALIKAGEVIMVSAVKQVVKKFKA